VATLGDVVDQNCHGCDGQHRGEVRDAEGKVVGVEAVGIGHVALPGQ
jgi:hypothetical protein